MAQNVSASLKAKNLWPRWMKMAKKYLFFGDGKLNMWHSMEVQYSH